MSVCRQSGESVIMIGCQKHKLRHHSIVEGSVSLRSKADCCSLDEIGYFAGIDFTVDYKEGTIQRTYDSNIPDWGAHVLYGKVNFDHTHYDNYGNEAFTLYIDYNYMNLSESNNINSISTRDYISRARNKLRNGEEFTYVVYGDSISPGQKQAGKNINIINDFITKSENNTRMVKPMF